ncbi:MAG: enoyl-CoA hydratase [Oceanicoccus sp.]|jgi:enoyl-CoA hydratase
MSETKYQTLNYIVVNHIAEIVLSRPPLNLIDRQLTEDYHAALLAADADSEVRVIILSGTGKGLSGGVDLKYLESFTAAQMKDFLRLFYVATLDIVRGLKKPIIASVHGYAREGACTLAMGCDMVIAAEDADFGYPGVPNLAAPPGMHVWFLQRLIGRMRAAELIFTGEPISATEAARLGLITRVVPTQELRKETLSLATKIAQMSPLALKKARDLMYQMEDMNFSDVPETALESLSSSFDTQDSIEARKAFIEKRKPVWVGK